MQEQKSDTCSGGAENAERKMQEQKMQDRKRQEQKMQDRKRQDRHF